jgi:hypothetical protein
MPILNASYPVHAIGYEVWTWDLGRVLAEAS